MLFFALCDWFDFVCNQIDVNVAFTYAYFEEVIHIKPPTGVNVPHGYVLRFAYGVLWPEACTAHVVSADDECFTHFGFTKCVSDPCIYFKMIIKIVT